MPLVPCHECDRLIRSKARRCPHCGAPGPKYAPPLRWEPVLLAAAVSAAVLAALHFLTR